MKIKALKKMEGIEELGGWKNEGMTLEEIVSLEGQYNEGQPFPEVYREYLFLGGKHSGVALDSGLGFDWLQKKSQESLKECNISIDRPYFVIDQLDACEQFGFFFLDEKDEDPIIYNCDPYDYIEGRIPLYVEYEQKRLSKIIEALIEQRESSDKYDGYDDEP